MTIYSKIGLKLDLFLQVQSCGQLHRDMIL